MSIEEKEENRRKKKNLPPHYSNSNPVLIIGYTMFDFEKLDVYQKSKIFYKEIKSFLKTNKIDKELKDQLNRASISIILNIAEGSGRFSKKEKKNFYSYARGSVYECVTVLDLIFTDSDFDKEIYNNFYNQCETLSKMFFRLIQSTKN
ncbi:MAG: four helix bundle protein [Pseudomonadota bacterium]